ncbi:MAG TPA: glycosyltransferase family 4 protein, partial [Chloroflexota bacterium]|nr:glycosyltransferase family 4 protein [Chloroflexota bacterium]
MRIALVSPYDFAVPGGVTTHIVNLSERFRDLGHSVHVLAPSSTEEPEDTVADFHRVGKTIVPLRTNASIARVSFSLTLGPQVKRILAENDFDIIHLHEPAAPLLPWYVLWHSRCVNVATFHASRETPTVYRTYKPFIKRLFKR